MKWFFKDAFVLYLWATVYAVTDPTCLNREGRILCNLASISIKKELPAAESRVPSLMLHLQITLNISWTRTDTRTEEQQRAHKPLQCFPVQKEITDAVGLLPASQARSVCICVFSCVQCSTQAHSALRFGRGFWPRPKQKATVVSLQIACSKYRSTTEASEEDIDGYARGRALGKQMAFKRPSAHGSSEMEYRLSVSLTIGQDGRRIITPSFVRPKEKGFQIRKKFYVHVLCTRATFR